MRCVLLLILCCLSLSAAEIIFPNDSKAVLDVKRDLGATGDGKTDDTAALQQAVYRCQANDFSRTIYLPKGVYRITRPLVFKPNDKGGEGAMVGPWFYGQDRDTTVIRLDDKSEGFGDPGKPQAAIRTMSRPDGAHMNADFFDRTIVNLTVDTGDNPGAIGVLFYSNNTGLPAGRAHRRQWRGRTRTRPARPERSAPDPGRRDQRLYHRHPHRERNQQPDHVAGDGEEGPGRVEAPQPGVRGGGADGDRRAARGGQRRRLIVSGRLPFSRRPQVPRARR